jgi:hypothetical protein
MRHRFNLATVPLVPEDAAGRTTGAGVRDPEHSIQIEK